MALMLMTLSKMWFQIQSRVWAKPFLNQAEPRCEIFYDDDVNSDDDDNKNQNDDDNDDDDNDDDGDDDDKELWGDQVQCQTIAGHLWEKISKKSRKKIQSFQNVLI